ncbi:uncharacterized protein BDCG_16317 [Blastomyces dermatitidis ER-3]|uniref:Uncharacterized protein n=2 Tax=Ajellomyces dermatitidis TaxID=5039 RepID=A0A0J9EME6_AJEDA|nr:uncharacterized protein BDCG_16317 [Blastomyces dermatitidis ER-3]KMW67493.1 hypothetical protein BDDG_12149 [Blastomyces dermatitidis ATCC 18188]OAS99800.1 hypothetical protein BDCG_16317 [Blastomyces dermatitidis ER-3]
MMTPVMVVRIGWRAYPFFSAWNAILIPFIWFFYPETAGRSLEEINHIFAKGYVEKMNYVKVAKALPKLTDEGVDRKAKEYRLARHNLRYENVKQGSLSSWAGCYVVTVESAFTWSHSIPCELDYCCCYCYCFCFGY